MGYKKDKIKSIMTTAKQGNITMGTKSKIAKPKAIKPLGLGLTRKIKK